MLSCPGEEDELAEAVTKEGTSPQEEVRPT